MKPDETQARLTAAGDQFGAALRDALSSGMALALAKTLQANGQTGPWLLDADGGISEVEQ